MRMMKFVAPEGISRVSALAALVLSSSCQSLGTGQVKGSSETALPKVTNVQSVIVVGPDHSEVGLLSSTRYGPGSGLRMIGKTQDVVRFLYVTDRGPNTDGPLVESSGNAEQKLESKIFQVPNFAPRFGVLEWRIGEKKAYAKTHQSLVHDGQPMSGLPLPQGSLGFTGEAGLDVSGQVLEADPFGIDPEGIDWDADGNLYICEEYRPSILKVEQATGRVKEIWTAGNGLPDSFRDRRANRGLEGLALTPSGDLVAVLQSTISLKDAGLDTKKTAPFIRGMRRSALSQSLTEFAIPVSDRFLNSGEAKIGDLVALSDDSFLMITQGKLRDGTFGSFIDRLDTSGACDLSKAQTPEGKPMEFMSSLQELGEVCTPAKVTQLVRLEELGWNHTKAEGLALVDQQTVAVINDNDFGVGDEGPDAQTTLLVLTFDKPLL